MKLVPLDRQRLKEHGVTLAKSDGGWLLSCDECGASWPVPTHVIPRSYWVCPAFWCNADASPPARKKSKPEPETKREPEEDLLEKAIGKALENYNFYMRMAREAKDDEAKGRFEREASRHLDEYLAQIEVRNALEGENHAN